MRQASRRRRHSFALACLLTLLAISGSSASLAPAAVPAKGVTGFFGTTPGTATTGNAAGQLNTPRGVAVNQSTGTVYAVDGTNNRIVAFNSSGKFLRAFGPDVVAFGPGQANEVQAVAVNATAGNFTLTFNGQTTGNLPATATAAEVQAALNALTTIGELNPAGSVTVTGDAGATSPYKIAFGGSLAVLDVAQITATNVSLSGGSPATAITTGTVNNGVTGYEICVPTNGDGCKAGGTGAFGGGFNAAQGIAVNQSSGDVYVTEQGNRRVSQFDANGNFIRAFGKDVITTGFPGNSLAASAVQTLTVTATAGKYKLKFGGKETAELPYNATAAEVKAALEGLASIGTGNINVTGAGPYAITFAGNLANNPEPLITTESGPGEPLVGGTATVVNTTTGSNEYEICVEGNVCKAGANAPQTVGGAFSTAVGHPAVAPAGAPNAGNLLVADATNARVQEFTSAGAFIRAFGWNVVKAGPSETAPTNQFEVCSTTAGDVCQAGSTGTNNGQFGAATPNRLAEDASGNLYTVEVAANFRVQKFTLPGNVPTPQGVFDAADLTGSSAANAPLDVAVNPTGGANVLVTKAFAAGATASCPITGTASVAERRVLEVSSGGTLEGTHGTCAGLSVTNPLTQTNESGLGVRQSTGDLYLSATVPASRIYVLNTGQPAAPSASITNVSGINAHGATISAFVNPSGPEVPYGQETTYKFEFKRSADASFTALDGTTEASAGNRTTTKLISQQITGLQAGTSYDVRIVASKPFGSGSATSTVTFNTPAAAPEPIVTPSVYLDGSNATFGGSVNPNNSSTSYHFEYVDQAGFQASGFAGATKTPAPDASVGSGAAPVSVAKEVPGLSPGTYHLRLLATNGTGSAISQPTTFTVEASGGCANEAIREAQKSTTLPEGTVGMPDCMALEMVSPAQKENQSVRASFLPSNSVSIDGDHAFFRANAAFAETVAIVDVNRGDVYIASRGKDGWTTKATILRPMTAGDFTEPKGLAPDLSSWFQIAPETTDLQTEQIFQAFRSSLGGPATPFSQLLVTPDEPQTIATYAGSSRDASHLYIKANALTARFQAGDPKPAGTGARTNVYVLTLGDDGQPEERLLARDSLGRAWGANCGARVGGDTEPLITQSQSTVRTRVQGAISEDGSRVYFSTRPSQPQSGNCNGTNNRMRILERTETPSGPLIRDLVQNECIRVAPACNATDGDDLFQGASADGNRIYFTTTRQLVNSDLDSGAACTNTTGSCGFNSAQTPGWDLYLYEKLPAGGHNLIQVSAGDASDPTPGSGARVFNNIGGISTDGTHVYFVAEGVLTTTPNQLGAVAKAGQPNFYLYERSPAHPNGRTVFIGAAAEADAGKFGESGGLWGESNDEAFGQSSVYPVPAMDSSGDEIGGDGHILLFRSKAPLVPNDADGITRDIYRYDSAAGSLQCVSCVPGADKSTGAAASGGGEGLGSGNARGPGFASLGRWVGEDGKTVLFETQAPLLSGDPNELGSDEYLWRDGQLTRLPGADLSESPTTSRDGSTIAFRRVEQLLPQDGDGAPDLYALRSGGGFPIAPQKEVCESEPCQEPFHDQPLGATVGTGNGSGGNFVEPGTCKKGFVRKQGKCVRPPCKKGFVRKKGKCVKRRHAKKHHHRKHRAAGTKQGGSK